MTYEEILQTVNVAFNEKVKKVLKKSYNKTIDVQFGIYEDGRLTINLKPSHGWRDWLINFMAWGRVHYGYKWEYKKYCWNILATILTTGGLWEASRKGTIIAGRSKGGAEAIFLGMLLTMHFKYPNVIVGAIDPPKAFPPMTVPFPCTTICYKNDIVPGIPFWYHHVGEFIQLGKRTHGLSFKDHERATTDYDLIRVWFE